MASFFFVTYIPNISYIEYLTSTVQDPDTDTEVSEFAMNGVEMIVDQCTALGHINSKC